MDGTPVHQRHHAHTLSHLGALRITKPSTIMFLGDGRKPEKSKETNTTPGEHSKLHIDSSSGSNWPYWRPVLAILKMSERTSMASDGSQYSYCKTTNKKRPIELNFADTTLGQGLVPRQKFHLLLYWFLSMLFLMQMIRISTHGMIWINKFAQHMRAPNPGLRAIN